jgi:hypothetical protein
MPQQRKPKRSTSRRQTARPHRSSATGEPRSRPAPPEDTNREHAAAPGQLGSIPGAGIIGMSAAEVRTRSYRGDVAQLAPGAARPEALNPPMPTPADLPEAIGSAGPAADETADPNFTAAKPGARGRAPSRDERRDADRRAENQSSTRKRAPRTRST